MPEGVGSPSQPLVRPWGLVSAETHRDACVSMQEAAPGERIQGPGWDNLCLCV